MKLKLKEVQAQQPATTSASTHVDPMDKDIGENDGFTVVGMKRKPTMSYAAKAHDLQRERSNRSSGLQLRTAL